MSLIKNKKLFNVLFPKEKIGGKMTNDEIAEQRLANKMWRNSSEGKQKLDFLKSLSNDEKLAYARLQTKKGKEEYEKRMGDILERRAQEIERKEAKEERLRAREEREAKRLADEANKGNIWDSITKEAINLTGKIPGVGAIMKPVLTETYKGLKGLGVEEDGFELHVVQVSKDIPLEEAIKISKNFIKGNKHFMKEGKNYYKFRNIPKQKFIKSSYRTKKVNKDIRLVYGQLK